MTVFLHADDTPELRLNLRAHAQVSRRNVLSQLFSPLPDIDSGIVLYKEGKAVDESYFGQLSSKDGSIQHRADETVGTPVVPSPDFFEEQYDVDLKNLNYSINAFNLFLFSQKPLITEKRSVEKMEVSLVFNGVTLYQEEHVWEDTGDTGIHVASFERVSKEEWSFRTIWEQGDYTDIRSCHELTGDSHSV